MKGKLKLLAMLCTLLLFLSVSCQQAVEGVQSAIEGEGEIKAVKVTAGQANIRSGCANDAPVLQTSPKDTKLDVIGRVADWYAIQLPDNKIGFCSKAEATPVITGQQQGGNAENDQTSGQAGSNQGATGNNPEPQIPTDTDSNSNSLTSDEQEMFRLVNEARSQNGVAALTIDMELTNVARIKAQDMIDNNYFSHNSPTYGSPFDMMKNFGIEYVKAGENIAGNQTVQNAHESLMNSPGHRKNILSPDYTHLGIGIKNGGSYGKMFSQMFISKPQ